MAGLAFAGLVADNAANAAGAEKLHDIKSSVQAWIIPAQEEAQIAADACAVMDKEAPAGAARA
jgi:acetate kinase